MNKSRFRLLYSLGVLACALPLALSSSSLSKGNAEGLFDYSNGTNVAYLGGGDLLAKCGVEGLSQSEIDYLNHNNDYRLAYSEAFKDDDVKTAIVDNSLLVFAHEKKYTDYSGREWTWVPISVSIPENHPFSPFDDFYVVELEGKTDLSNLKINYELSLDVSSQLINSYINKSYQDALSLDNIYQQYQADLAYYNRRPKSIEQYNFQVLEYQRYLEKYQEYLNKYENYQAYLISKDKYDNDLASYNEYLEAKHQYELDLLAYQKYQEDYAYYQANHEQNVKDYNEFGKKYDDSRYQLNAMHIAYTEDTARERTLASYILSGTVAEVIAHKDELNALGVPSTLVDSADTATVRLRTFFREYQALTSDEARYSYYYINYNYIKLYSNVLLRSIERLARYPNVRNLAKDNGKLEAFNTLIFQLIYFTNAISDTIVYNYEAFNPVTNKGDMSKEGAAKLDETFYIDGKTYLTWLKGYNFLDTTLTATPSTGILPTEPVELIPEPKKVDLPVEPAVVVKPVEPTLVEEPVAPAVVFEPIEYDPSATAPDYPALLNDEYNLALLEAYQNGDVNEKELLQKDVNITIQGEHEIVVSEHLANVAVFHNYLDVVTQYVFFGTKGVEYHGEIPTRPGDEASDEYFFQYWTNEKSDSPAIVNLALLSESANLYPVFEHGDLNRYDITWVYPDGSVTIHDIVYGSFPSAPWAPVKQETEDHYYNFIGWSLSSDGEILEYIPSVSEDTTFYARFEELDIFDVHFDIDGNILSKRVKESYLAEAPISLELDDGTSYIITGWQEDFSPIKSETTYHALFKKYYTITWRIITDDSTKEYTEKYLAGNDNPITYKGVIPEVIREEDKYRVFSFDQPLGYATSNRTITGSYVDTIYPEVNLQIDNNYVVLTGSYLNGESVDLPLFYNSDLYHYDITSWNQSGGKYTAKFNKIKFVEASTYSYMNNLLYVDVTSEDLNEINLETFFNIVKTNKIQDSDIKIKFEDGEVKLTSNQTKYLALKNTASISIEFNDLGDKSYSFRVVAKDSSGNEINLPDLTPDINIKKNIDYLHSQVYLGDEEVNSELSNNSIKVRAKLNQLYVVKPTYNVIIRASDAVECTLSQSSGLVGEKIHVSYTVKKGYRLSQFNIKTRSGKILTLDSQNEFTLPSEDVVVNFVCQKEKYTLDLYVDDALYASYDVSFGDTIYLPTYIKKVGTEEFEYIFTGWGIKTEYITIEGNTQLHAQFTTLKRDEKSEKKTSKAVQIAGYVAIGTLVSGFGVGLFFIFRKIRKH